MLTELRSLNRELDPLSQGSLSFMTNCVLDPLNSSARAIPHGGIPAFGNPTRVLGFGNLVAAVVSVTSVLSESAVILPVIVTVMLPGASRAR